MIRLALDALLEFNAPLGVIYRRFLLDPWVSSQLNVEKGNETLDDSEPTDPKPTDTSSADTAKNKRKKKNTKPSLDESSGRGGSVTNPGLFTVASAIYGASVHSEENGKEMVAKQRSLLQEEEKELEEEEDDELFDQYQTRKTILWNYQNHVVLEKSTIHQQIIAEYVLARLYCDETLAGNSLDTQKTDDNTQESADKSLPNPHANDTLPDFAPNDSIKSNPFLVHFLRVYIQFPQLRFLLFRILNGHAGAAELSSLPISSVLNQCVKVAYDLRGNPLGNSSAARDKPPAPQGPGAAAAAQPASNGKSRAGGKKVRGSSVSATASLQQATHGSNKNDTADAASQATNDEPQNSDTHVPKLPGAERKHGAGWIAGLPIWWIQNALLEQGLSQDEILQVLTPTDPIDILDRLEDVVSAPVYSTTVETRRVAREAKLALTMFQQSQEHERDQGQGTDCCLVGQFNTIYVRNVLPLAGVDPTTMEPATPFEFPGLCSEPKEVQEEKEESEVEQDENDEGEEPAGTVLSSFERVKELYKEHNLSEKKIQRQVVGMYQDRFVLLIKSQSSIESFATRNPSSTAAAVDLQPSSQMLTSQGTITETKKAVLEALLFVMAAWPDQPQEYQMEEGIKLTDTKQMIRKTFLDALCATIESHVSNEAVDLFFTMCVYSQRTRISGLCDYYDRRDGSSGSSDNDDDGDEQGGMFYLVRRGDELREFIYGVILRWLEGANAESFETESEQEGNLSEVRLICLVIKALHARGQLEPKSEYNLLFGFFMRYIGQVKEAREVYFLS